MLHNIHFSSDRSGRSAGRIRGGFRLIILALVTMAMSMAGRSVLNAQDSPNITLTLSVPSEITVNEGEHVTFEVRLNSSWVTGLFLLSSSSDSATFTITTIDMTEKVGTFSWTPSEAEGGQSYVFVFKGMGIYSDGLFPKGEQVIEEVTITVNEVNNAPVLAYIPDVVGQLGEVMTFTLSATDDGFPTDGLTYSMSGSLPSMSLDPVTGAFSWAVSGTSPSGVYPVTFTVTDDGALSYSQGVMFSVEGVNMLNNRGFQVAGKTVKQAKYWKGVGLLPGDKRLCNPISETEWNCEFQFSATLANATNRRLRQTISTDLLGSSETLRFTGTFRADALTNGARVQLVAKLADGQTKRATVKLIPGDESTVATFHSFEQTLTLTAAPVSMWLEISTGKSSGKLFLDNLVVINQPPAVGMVAMPAMPNTDAPTLIPVPAAPDLRGGAAIGMGQ